MLIVYLIQSFVFIQSLSCRFSVTYMLGFVFGCSAGFSSAPAYQFAVSGMCPVCTFRSPDLARLAVDVPITRSPDRPITRSLYPTPPPIPISKGLTPFIPIDPQSSVVANISTYLKHPHWIPIHVRLRDQAEGRNPKMQKPGLKPGKNKN
jgi:hypothetical protein